jgi:acetyl-CoA acetyltransferase
MLDVYVSGVGMTSFGKKKESLQELIAEAATKALQDARFEEVDAIYVGVMNPEAFIQEGNFASLIADYLNLVGIPAIRVETASSSGAAAFHAAYQAIASGYHRNVLVLGGEKMTHLNVAQSTKILAEVIDRYERSCGVTMPALAAMLTERYLKEYKISQSTMQKMLALVAMKNHHNGSLNPYAQFRQIVSEKQYFESKVVSFPLRLYDCAPMTDGAAAVVLTSDKTKVRVAGLGQGTDTLAIRHRTSFTSFRATQLAALKAYQMARLNPGDIDFAEVHDAFTPFEIINTEDLGFFPPGKGAKALEKGETSLKGRLPINPSGGLKARGHPVGASGLAQIVEVIWQLRQQTEPARQLDKARIGLAQSIGGLATNNFVTILERTNDSRHVRSNWNGSYNLPRVTVRPTRKVNEEIGEEGVIETFTILYTTPEGFPSPLPLAFIKDLKGNWVIARGRSLKHLKIGNRVTLYRSGGSYHFVVRTYLDKINWIFRRILWKLSKNKYRNPLNVFSIRKKKNTIAHLDQNRILSHSQKDSNPESIHPSIRR